MSREPKKKPGDIQKARKRHLQQQARRDALSKLRQGEPINIWAHYDNGSTMVVVHPVETSAGDYVLCVVGKRLRVMYLYDFKENGNVLTDNYRRVVIPDKQIFGVVSRFLDFHWKCPDCNIVRKLSDKPELSDKFAALLRKVTYFTYDLTCRQCAMHCSVTIPNRVDE